MFDTQQKIQGFCNKLLSSDPDDHINYLDDFAKYLKGIKQLNYSTRTLETIIQRVDDCIENANTGHSASIVISYSLRVLVLLSTRLPDDFLPTFFARFGTKPFSSSLKYLQNNYISLFTEIFHHYLFTDEKKQQICVDSLFGIYVDLPRGNYENLISGIELLTSLTKSLGSLYTPKQREVLMKRAIELINPLYDKSTATVIDFELAWGTLSNDTQFESLINVLLQNSSMNISFRVLSSLVTHMPERFEPHISDLVNLFYPKIEALDTENEEEEETEEINSDQILENAQQSILSFCSLIESFPQLFIDTSDVYVELVFQFLFYNIDITSYDIIEDDINDDFIVDGVLEEPIEDEQMNDGSWKIRKSFHQLAEILIRHFPETFSKVLEENHEIIPNLMNENDEGSKITSLQLLVFIIKKFGNKITENDIVKCYENFVKQIEKETNLSLLSISYPSITTIILKRKSLPITLAKKMIDGLSNKFDIHNIKNVLNLINAILSTSNYLNDITANIVNLLSKILYDKNIPTKSECFNTISYLYSQLKTTNSDALNCLNQKVLEYSKQNKSIESIYPLTLFFILHQQNQNNIQTIYQFYITSEIYAKPALSSFSLILVSPVYKELTAITEKIFEKLPEYVNSNDMTVSTVSLYFIYLSLNKNLIQSTKVTFLLPSLLNRMELNDFNSQKYTIKILQLLIPNSNSTIFKEVFTKITNLLFSALTDEIIEYLSELILLIPENSINFIDKLFKIINSNNQNSDDLVSNTSKLFGLLSTKSEFANYLITKIEPIIMSTTSPTKSISSSLYIIGEIGSRNSLISNSKLINRIFELINDKDRNIFTPASYAIGCISSKTYLEQLNDIVIKDTNHLSIWLHSYVIMLLHITSKDRLVNVQNIFEYFTKSADYKKETKDDFIQFFYLLLKISSHEYIDKYIKLIHENNLISPILLQSIFNYLQICNDENEMKQILEQIEINSNEPISCSYAINCYKTCIKNSSLHNIIDKQFENICRCITSNDKHFIKRYYGSEEYIEDIGQMMRNNSLDFVFSYIEEYNENVEDKIEIIINNSLNALNDNETSVQVKALKLFSLIFCEFQQCINKINLKVFAQKLKKINKNSEAFREVLKLFANVVTKTSMIKYCNELEKIYVKVQSDERFEKYVEEAKAQNVLEIKRKHRVRSAEICNKMMKEYNGEILELF